MPGPDRAEADLSSAHSVDQEEVARFAALAEHWWDPDGALKSLHALNPVRIGYVRHHVCARFDRDRRTLHPFDGLRFLDVGCGAGLIAEPMRRLGADVVAIDAAQQTIDVARAHAAEQGLEIDYRCATAETLRAGAVFDVVLALEIIEHVADPAAFVDTCGALVRPGGSLFVATINRTVAAYALAIVAAERVLGWVPRGSHDWRKFIQPAELVRFSRAAGLAPADISGVSYRPLTADWALGRNLSVNYIAHIVRPAA